MKRLQADAGESAAITPWRIFISETLVATTMVDVWKNGNKLMLLGLELGIVAVFGAVTVGDVSLFILLASVFVTVVGMLDDPPE